MSGNLLKDDKTSFRVLGVKCVMGLCLSVFLPGCFSSCVVSVSPRVRGSDVDKSKICPATVDASFLVPNCCDYCCSLYSHELKYKYAVEDELSCIVSKGDRPGTATLHLSGFMGHGESIWITLYHILTLGVLPIPNDNVGFCYNLSGSLSGGESPNDKEWRDDFLKNECQVYNCSSLFPTAYIPALIGFAMGDDVYVRFLGFGKDDVEFTASVFAEHVKKQAAAYLTKYSDKIYVWRETDQERADRISKRINDVKSTRKLRSWSSPSRSTGVNYIGGFENRSSK